MNGTNAMVSRSTLHINVRLVGVSQGMQLHVGPQRAVCFATAQTNVTAEKTNIFRKK